MERRQEIIREIHLIKQSDIPQKEKDSQILTLARELGRIMLEKDNPYNKNECNEI